MALPDPSFPEFTITAISSWQTPIANGAGRVTKPAAPFTAWSLANQASFADGPNGSNAPVGLLLPSTVAAQYSLHLKVSGTYLLPQTWPEGSSICQLQGTLYNNDNTPSVVVLSETWTIVLPSQQEARPLLTLDVSNLSIADPFMKWLPNVPFRIAGDFRWEIINKTRPTTGLSSFIYLVRKECFTLFSSTLITLVLLGYQTDSLARRV
jgi:hypothetical protein